MERAIAPRRASQQLLFVTTGAVLVNSAIVFFAFFVSGEGHADPLVGWLTITLATAAVGTAVWFFDRDVYRTGSTAGLANRTFALGVIAIVCFPFLWPGSGPLFAATILLGLKARAGGERTKGYLGITLGAIAFVFSLVIILLFFG